MIAPAIDLRSIDQLTKDPRNARTHSPDQVELIKGSIRRFGWTNPMLVDDVIRAGNGRFEAASQMYEAGEDIYLAPGRDRGGAKLPPRHVPVIDCTGWTPEECEAYALADNQIALQAGWDEEQLGASLKWLAASDFNVEVIGFDQGDLAELLAEPKPPTDPEDTPEPPDCPVTVLGDVWLLADHRIMCGSSTDPEDMAAAMAGATPDIANSDPPYGINVVKNRSIGGAKAFGSVHGRGRDGFDKAKRHAGKVHGGHKREIIRPGVYAAVIGDDSTETGLAHYRLLVQFQIPVIVLWGGNYFAGDQREKPDQAQPLGLPPSRCWLIWDKENSGTFADAEMAWTNQDRVLKLLRHQWNGLLKASERGERRVHPTQKPVALADWVIDTLAPEARLVFDGFLGSGWTLISAERKGIRCIAMELSPAYVDVALIRWERFTGRKATLEATGQTFDQVAADRGIPLATVPESV